MLVLKMQTCLIEKLMSSNMSAHSISSHILTHFSIVSLSFLVFPLPVFSSVRYQCINFYMIKIKNLKDEHFHLLTVVIKMRITKATSTNNPNILTNSYQIIWPLRKQLFLYSEFGFLIFYAENEGVHSRSGFLTPSLPW